MEGPAGIGKSRLLGEFARREQDRAAAGMRVVAVPATEFEQSSPLQLVHDILDRLAELDRLDRGAAQGAATKPYESRASIRTRARQSKPSEP